MDNVFCIGAIKAWEHKEDENLQYSTLTPLFWEPVGNDIYLASEESLEDFESNFWLHPSHCLCDYCEYQDYVDSMRPANQK